MQTKKMHLFSGKQHSTEDTTSEINGKFIDLYMELYFSNEKKLAAIS